jgi:hypothetical protein
MSVPEALIHVAAAAESERQLAEDLVKGAGGIALFLFGSDAAKFRRKIYHLSAPRRKDRLPVFRMGNQLFARKSTLLRAIADREADR